MPNYETLHPIHTTRRVSSELRAQPKVLRNQKFQRFNASRAQEIAFILVPLLCCGLYFRGGEAPWLVVSFALLFYRSLHSLWSDITYSGAYISIFEKYETRLKELDDECARLQAAAPASSSKQCPAG
jgi:hypothetical protein